MADSSILPYNLERFPKIMQETLDKFDNKNVTSLLEDGGVTLSFLKDAVQNFSVITKKTMKNLRNIKKKHDPMELRIVNDQMMQLERVFNMPNGIPDRPEIRNAIFAPGKFNSYGGSAFPGITDLLHEIEDLDRPEKSRRYEKLKRHVSDLMIMIQEATRFLMPVNYV